MQSWILQGIPNGHRPVRVRGLQQNAERMILHTGKGDVSVERDNEIIAVLADLGGAVLKKLMLKKNYGVGQGQGLSSEEIYQAILGSHPILDLYLFHGDGTPKAALRITPGGFNVKGLGEAATYSAVQNMNTIMEALKKYAGRVYLEMDFGMAQLPGCKPMESLASPEGRRQALPHVERYGAFLVQMHQNGGLVQKTESDTKQAAQLLEGIGLSSGDLQSAAGLLATAGVMQMAEGDNDEKQKLPGEEAAITALPPPPPAVKGKTSLWRLIAGIGTAGLIAIAYALVHAYENIESSRAVAEGLMYYAITKGGIAFLVGGILFWMAFYHLRLKRWMQNTPTSKARSVAMGMVEMKGTAQRAYNVLSPLTQMACIYYRVEKYRRKRDHKGNVHWELVNVTSSGPVPFYLQDDTGRILVDPNGADVKPGYRQEYSGAAISSLMWGPTSSSGGMISSRKFGHGGVENDEKFVEELIVEDSQVYVLGMAMPRRQERDSLRQRVGERMRKMKQSPGFMARYDMDKNGEIDDNELAAARVDAESIEIRNRLKETETAREQGDNVVITQPKHRGLPFVVIDGEEDGLTTKYGWYTGLSFAGAVGLTILGLVLMIH